MIFEHLDQIEEVFRHIQVFIDHILNLLLHHLVELGCVHRLLFAAEHGVECSHSILSIDVRLLRFGTAWGAAVDEGRMRSHPQLLHVYPRTED